MSQMDSSTVAGSPEQLREAMVGKLLNEKAVRSAAVEGAFRAVPRDRFAPEATLEAAYAIDVVITKRDERGLAVSSVSAPNIQALMLEQADLKPGMRVLEIGSGGYNAALIAEIVGPEGTVTTLDIDPFVTERAKSCLLDAGYEQVHVVLGDGSAGCPGFAPFDRIIVTVGAWDIPPAWVDQLSEDGLLVVPLRMRGLTRSLALRRTGLVLVSESAEVCGFVRMQGSDAHEERLVQLAPGEVGLRIDEMQPVDADLLDGVLDTPRVSLWTGVTVGRGEPFDSLYLWTASVLAGHCFMSVDPSTDTGRTIPANKLACPAVVDGASFAYLGLRRISEDGEPPTFEFGAHGHGPDAGRLVEALTAQVQVWNLEHRHGPDPVFTVQPVEAPAELLPSGSAVITKRHRRITISWQ
ncbi:hypothetical protein GCM10009665_29490 [Kitasatospora nipponensis]|uniref:Protein-L-isoaspartate O-methyltransferase n=1 Tax=Kitasatospora nipponensis TaxID=258049 RepID=A0ABN1W6F7_9ACTN